LELFLLVCDLEAKEPNMPRLLFLFLLVLAAANDPAQAARGARPAITPTAVNDSQWSGTANDRRGSVLLKAQVLLDRAGFSSGAIEDRDGENFANALRAFQRAHELEPTGKLDRATWDQLIHTSDEAVMRDYTIMAADVMGPFVKSRLRWRWACDWARTGGAIMTKSVAGLCGAAALALTITAASIQMAQEQGLIVFPILLIDGVEVRAKI
jgi:hypothetical protein